MMTGALVLTGGYYASAQVIQHFGQGVTVETTTQQPPVHAQGNQTTPASPTTSARHATTVSQQTHWTMGVWYPNRTFAPLAFKIPLPTSRGPFTGGRNPYRQTGSYWVGAHNMQVAVSFVTTSVTDFSHSAPPGDHLLTAGGNAGDSVKIWSTPQGKLDANELVSLGTTQYGWPRAFGGSILHDRTALINITAPNTPANRVLAEKMLARWSVVDTHTNAISRVPFSRWLPSWPLNPVKNSNASALPGWMRTAAIPSPLVRYWQMSAPIFHSDYGHAVWNHSTPPINNNPYWHYVHFTVPTGHVAQGGVHFTMPAGAPIRRIWFFVPNTWHVQPASTMSWQASWGKGLQSSVSVSVAPGPVRKTVSNSYHRLGFTMGGQTVYQSGTVQGVFALHVPGVSLNEAMSDGSQANVSVSVNVPLSSRHPTIQQALATAEGIALGLRIGY